MYAHSPEDQPYPGLHQEKCDQQVEGGDSASLLCSALVRPQLQSCIQLWSPQQKKNMEQLLWVQKKVTKLIRGLKHLSCEEKLRELGLLSLEMIRETLLRPFST